MKIFKRITANMIASLTILAAVPLAANAEWRQDNNGWWYSQGSSYATSWMKIDEQWYYFDSNGYMKTGWVQDNGNWYYLNGDGTLARDTTIEGYSLNGNGNISCH
jgi:glucan-binding YG repeat protein